MIKNLPVRLNENYEIVDCFGDIIFPDITRFRYRESGQVNMDFTHVDRQKAIGKFVVELINSMPEQQANLQNQLNDISAVEEIAGKTAEKLRGLKTK